MSTGILNFDVKNVEKILHFLIHILAKMLDPY
jgi:hypothetical protein